MTFQNKYRFLMGSKYDITRYNILIIIGEILKVTKIANTKRGLQCTDKEFVSFRFCLTSKKIIYCHVGTGPTILSITSTFWGVNVLLKDIIRRPE